MKIVIEARLPRDESGGVTTYVRLLLTVAAYLPDYSFFFVRLSSSNWHEGLKIPSNVAMVTLGSVARRSQEVLKNHPRTLVVIRKLYQLLLPGPMPDEALNRLLREIGASVYHSPIQDCPKVDISFVYHPHDLQHLRFPENFSQITVRFRERIWKKLAFSADTVILGSHFMASEFEELWGLPRDLIRVIPAPSPEGTRGPKGEDFGTYFLYPANLYKHKNHETLIQAFGMANRNDVRLLLTGAGPEDEALKSLVETMGLDGRVQFVGSIPNDELLRLVRGALAVVIPSRYEAGSFPMVDALASDTPVIASDIPPFREIVDDRIRIFGSPDDVESLAAELSKACMTRASIENVRNRPTWSVTEFAGQLHFVYKGLAGTPT